MPTHALADTFGSLTYGATTNLDFADSALSMPSLSLTGDVIFTTSNKAIGKYKSVKIQSDATIRNYTFPSGWIWIGNTAPANIAATKTAILSLACYGPNDTDVVASYAVQP